MFIATRIRRFIENNLSFTLLVIITAIFVFIGGYALFSQARISNPHLALSKNWKAWFILGCYVGLALVSLMMTGRRARVLALKLKRIPQKDDCAPLAVKDFIQDEYWRTAAIAYVSQPKGTKQKGWGALGGPYDGVRFRRMILDTVPVVDAHARHIVPRLPILRPHIRMAQHLRPLAALFPPERVSCIQKYDTTVQMARYSDQELSETGFDLGMRAYQDIVDILSEYRVDNSDPR